MLSNALNLSIELILMYNFMIVKAKISFTVVVIWFTSFYQRACAQNTSAQFFVGYNFDDQSYALNTKDGLMYTTALDHFSYWAYGSNLFFVSLLSGKFVDAQGQLSGDSFKTYIEWHPRLSLSKIFNKKIKTSDKYAFGVTDVFLAGQINQGNNYHARMAGISVDLRAPFFSYLLPSVYYRYDNSDLKTWHTTTFFGIPLYQNKRLEFSLQGFLDVYDTQSVGLDWYTQTNITWTISKLFAPKAKNIVKLGVEMYHHSNNSWTTTAPQVLLRWSWF